VIVEELPSIAALEAARLATSCGAYCGVARLRSLEVDTRWRTHYIAVRLERALVGVLPTYALLVDAWPDPAYNLPAAVGSSDSAASGREWLLVGGRTDHAAGFLRAEDAPAEFVARAAREAGRAAEALARTDGRRLAAAYVNPVEREYLAAAFAADASERVVTREALLPVVGDGVGDYLASLRSSQRSVVRRDWRERERLRLATRLLPWLEVMQYAPALVADVAVGHGAPEHPLLVRMRLESWLANPEITTFAFEVTAGSDVLAVSLAWRWRDLLQLYEVGLAPIGTPGRHVAYVEALIYAPLRHAAAIGCSELRLGMDSSHPKRVRGASLRDVAILLEEPRPARVSRAATRCTT